MRLAFSALLATLFSLGLGVALGLARQHPLPGPIVTTNGTIMTIGLFALPLVWWRHEVGYACAVAVGGITIIGDVSAIIIGLPFDLGMPEGTMAIIVSQVVVSVVVIFYGIRAWRE